MHMHEEHESEADNTFQFLKARLEKIKSEVSDGLKTLMGTLDPAKDYHMTYLREGQKIVFQVIESDGNGNLPGNPKLKKRELVRSRIIPVVIAVNDTTPEAEVAARIENALQDLLRESPDIHGYDLPVMNFDVTEIVAWPSGTGPFSPEARTIRTGPEDERTFAKMGWAPEDVSTIRPAWTLDRCRDFLSRMEDSLRDRLTELGWEVLETLATIYDRRAK